MDFEPCFKVYNLVSISPKSMKLGQMTNLNVIFHMVGSVYRLVTIRNSPQFPVEFRNGLLNRPFYSCVLSYLACDCKRGWGRFPFDQIFRKFRVKSE